MNRSFNELNMIFFPNVLIAFNAAPQAGVHGLLHASWRRLRIRALGCKEVLKGATPHDKDSEELDGREDSDRKSA